eukprot:TRINITY_DN21953_c2_g1_i1.p1 TRINITY_DN21953_c2_g1~~TRINITY_DN21953_c2_g1_i1.p1  ORF type:complete len:734 (+),score=198.72 TRINITY_DN21953_c2_g1_i1:96-2297(+)
MAEDGAVGGRTELLNVLGDVKARVQDKLGIVDFPMPQFCLIGRQSVGKSRLIEALAGETFNFISGTLGSRRPTVLEFRNVAALPKSRWHVRDLDTLQWQEQPIDQVMKIVGEAHEKLGQTCSPIPLYVRVESAGCVDVQIVDLPGFRDFALDDSKKQLAMEIEELVLSFMKDPRNTMICVEQAGDAATMSTLNRCKEIDPSFSRTVLIRNKLDKYYKDLTPDNVNQWADGFGDLPPKLDRFALSLPFWQDGQNAPDSLIQLREAQHDSDIRELSSRGMDPAKLKQIGFKNFAEYMENKIQDLFVKALGPVMEELEGLKQRNQDKEKQLTEEYTQTDPTRVESTTRECGMSFAEALNFHMAGQIVNGASRVTIEEELRAFHEFHMAVQGSAAAMCMLPTDDFCGLDEYIEFLTQDAGVGVAHIGTEVEQTPLSGGAQWRRLMQEVEIFLRFSEIAVSTKKKDVIQARGIAMTSLTWRDVVVKLLNNEAHVPLLQRVRYVGERIRWFFTSQKEAILDFMTGLETAPMARSYSSNLLKHGKLIKSNAMIKHMIFETYDSACQRQLTSFLQCFEDLLTSQFSNPWVFLKGATAGSAIDGKLPTDPAERIPLEIQSRCGVDSLVNRWLQDIPTEATAIDDAVDKVQQLVLLTYRFIRSSVCDQVDLMAELFFKLPMLRRLGEDMGEIGLSGSDKDKYAARRERLDGEKSTASEALKEIQWCIDRLAGFRTKVQASTGF